MVTSGPIDDTLLTWMFRRITYALSYPLVWLMMPFKLLAWRLGPGLFRRIVFEITSFVDWAMVFANLQNGAMRLYYGIYKGNFPFGKALMVVDLEAAARDIPQPTMRGNRFMGVELVHNEPAAFLPNSVTVATGPPVRGLIRDYIDTKVLTSEMRGIDLASLKEMCAPLLKEWSEDPEMARWIKIRGAATRMFLRLMTGDTLPKDLVDDVTWQYARRWVEFSVFARYLPSMLGLLGTREAMRRDVHFRLLQRGVEGMTIDVSLFGAMLSIGSIVIRCVTHIRMNQVDYASLSVPERMAVVIETERLDPTVTSVHRIVDKDETVTLGGRALQLVPGDEVAYPFVCIHEDEKFFPDPKRFRLDRTREEWERVLSWSAGPHVCPAKDVSILATVLMLDALSERYDLRTLRIFNPEF